jgi:micrococcal nuclease
MRASRFLALILLAALAVACAGPTISPRPTTSPTTGPTPSPAPTATASPSLEPGATPAPPEPVGPLQEAVVVRIVDGDTIWARFEGRDWRVRYIGIDAPEPRDVVPEPWATEATAANRALVAGQTVFLERDVSETDRFGRLLRYVWLPIAPDEAGADAWLLVNLELVRAGFARAVSFPPDVGYQEYLRAAEQDAREAGRGLWAEAGPAP